MKEVCSSPVSAPGYRARSRARLWWHPRTTGAAAALALALGAGGCSYQLESLRSQNGTEIERTGSPPPKTASLASESDLAAARAAVNEMLRKGGKSTTMPWENPSTGAHGTITPLASAYTQDGVTCHDFLASYVRDGSASWLQGEACSAKPGSWQVRQFKAWQRSDVGYQRSDIRDQR